MRTRRTTIQIIYDVLTLAKNGISKTRLMFKGNLSFTKLQEILLWCLQKGFLTKDKRKKSKTHNFSVFVQEQDKRGSMNVYVTTPKGLEYIKLVDELKALVEED